MASGEHDGAAAERQETAAQRLELLETVRNGLRWPMVALGIIWVALLIIDLAFTLEAPWAFWSAAAQFVIWGIFIVQFAVEFLLAPSKPAYLRQNWLTAIAVVLPAFRILSIFRVFRLVRLVRSISFLRIVTGANRGIRSLSRVTGVAQFPYVLGTSVIVVFAVAAGMAYFERGTASGLGSFGDALWWSAAMLTTIGSRDWPVTLEGRLLALLMMVYGMAVFGYITATLAGYFVRRNLERRAEDADERDLTALVDEVRSLREEIRALRLPARGRETDGS
jgi:voltage-gated potassium channel